MMTYEDYTRYVMFIITMTILAYIYIILRQDNLAMNAGYLVIMTVGTFTK